MARTDRVAHLTADAEDAVLIREEIVAALRSARAEADWAPDHDDPSTAWVYVIYVTEER